MLKRLLKLLLLLVVVVVAAAVAFVVTLQVTEFNPPAVEGLVVSHAPTTNIDPVELESGVSIKIMTWNLGYASLSETEDFVMDGGVKGRMDSLEEVEANIAGITDTLIDTAADIYFLQEVDEGSDRSYQTMQYTTYADLLSRPTVFGINYRCLFVPFPFDLKQMMGKVESGIATFSKFSDIETAQRIQLPGAFSWPLRLANLKRCITVVRTPIVGSDHFLVLINVHLSAYDDGTMRVQEMAALRDVMADEYDAGNFVVVGGDFNQSFPDAVTEVDGESSYHFPLKDPSYWEAFAMDGAWFSENGWQYGIDMTTPTCRLLNRPLDLVDDANNQYYLIDGFIVSPNITIESVETLDLGFHHSDHNPVVMTIHF